MKTKPEITVVSKEDNHEAPYVSERKIWWAFWATYMFLVMLGIGAAVAYFVKQ